MKVKVFNIFTFIFLVFSFCFASNVYATSYDSLNSRVNQNNKYLTGSNKLDYAKRLVLSDKYLRDMPEVNNVGFNKAQQKKIEHFAYNVVFQSAGSNMDDYQKLEAIHSWISNNIFRYKGASGISFNKKYDNPYTIIVEGYEGSIRPFARDNGYAALAVALIRSQGIPARVVQGFYTNDMNSLGVWNVSPSDNEINHVWVEAYVNDKWIMLDPMADCTNFYYASTNNYQTGNSLSIYENFDPTVMELSKTHLAFKAYPGLATYKNITDNYEKNRIVEFLNYNGNGSKMMDIYDPNDSSTWFGVRDYDSKVVNGHVTNIHWPNNKNITGQAIFSYFTKLESFALNNNKLTKAVFFGDTNLKTVNVFNNNLNYVAIRGTKKLTSFNCLNNPATYVEYPYNGTKRALIRSSGSGSVTAKYSMSGRKHIHVIKAKPNSNYRFDGWYQNGKRVSKNANLTIVNNNGFNYIAKFVPTKGTVVEVSISKQKIWYYKNGVLKHSADVVTGTRGIHNTPTGTFKIRSKARGVYLVGADYRSYVNFWMPIYADIGLHDATWRSRFGGSIYTYNGSHGCINLPYNTAKWIYNNVPTGTTVKVYK